MDQNPSGRRQSKVLPLATIRIAAHNEPCLANYATKQIDEEICRLVATLETRQVEELTYLKVLSTLQITLEQSAAARYCWTLNTIIHFTP